MCAIRRRKPEEAVRLRFVRRSSLPFDLKPQCGDIFGRSRHRCLLVLTLLFKEEPTPTLYYRQDVYLTSLETEYVASGQQREKAAGASQQAIKNFGLMEHDLNHVIEGHATLYQTQRL